MVVSADQNLIKSTFTTYFTHLVKREHIKAVDYIYPPLFKIIPKKALLSTMKQGDKSVDIKLGELSIEKYLPKRSIKKSRTWYLTIGTP